MHSGSFPAPPHDATVPRWPGPPHYQGFTITLRHTSLNTIPLDEWSARRKGLYLTAHNTHKRQTSMPPAGIETTIAAKEWTQTHNLDRSVFVILRLLSNLNSFLGHSLHVVFSTTPNFLFGEEHPVKIRTQKSVPTFDLIRASQNHTHSTCCNYLLAPILVLGSVRQ